MPETNFYNVWRTKSAHDRAALLTRMKEEAPALQAKPGFASMTVSECAEDGRVLVQGRWSSKDAFDSAVAHDPDALASRESLEKYGSPEPGLFTEVFRVTGNSAQEAAISSQDGHITFIQVWSVESAENQRIWLETMHRRIGLLTKQPGFVSMTLHASLDKKRTAVYAQWKDEATLKAAIDLPEAKAAHDEMAKWGSSDGSLYRVDAVFLAVFA